MKNFIFLEKFNNYYNRKVKYYANLVDYYEYEHATLEARNFVYNNGVNTTAVVNWKDEWSPDYLLVVDELGEIHSRWFVMGANRVLSGQYSVKLRRDLVADYYEKIRDVPMYVLKGNLKATNPLIYNKEQSGFNQIKKSETLLKDESGTPWIVGYIAKNFYFRDKDGTINKTITVNPNRNNVPILENLGIDFTDPLNPPSGGQIKYITKGILNGYYLNNDRYHLLEVAYRTNTGTAIPDVPSSAIIKPKDPVFKATNNYPQNTVAGWWAYMVEENYNEQIRAGFNNLAGSTFISLAEFESVISLRGKTVYSTTTSKYYTLQLGEHRWEQKIDSVDLVESEPTHSSLLSVAIASRNATISILAPQVVSHNGVFSAGYEYSKYGIYLVEAANSDAIELEFGMARKGTLDAPYDIFAMPYTEDNLILATQLAEEITSAGMYDLQIVPYCPAREFMTEEGIVLSGTAGVDYYNITQDEEPISYLLWSDKSSDTFNIQSAFGVPSSARQLKIQNETEFVRLVSPNYNGSFDFNVAKNGGVEFFKVSFTYKPYTPFIQVSPNFKNLYGGDFSDARGLICNGDFSIATISDAWKQYELNNKNYQNIFNTQIKTMDENHRLQMTQGAAQAGISAVGIGLSAGLYTGNPLIGMGAGALSAGAGIADLAIQRSMYQNNRASQVDLFNLQLGNVMALPDSLNKVSAYNINNKYFPFVELYSCTEEEKAILELKLKYEGMNVNSISTMRNFEEIEPDFNFFKAQLIMNQDIAENFEILDSIGYELERGIYL